MAVARVVARVGLTMQEINLLNLFNPSLVAELAADRDGEEVQRAIKVTVLVRNNFFNVYLKSKKKFLSIYSF